MSNDDDNIFYFGDIGSGDYTIISSILPMWKERQLVIEMKCRFFFTTNSKHFISTCLKIAYLCISGPTTGDFPSDFKGAIYFL